MPVTRDVLPTYAGAVPKFFLLPVTFLLLSNLFSAPCNATVFSSSIQSCEEQCVDRNIAIPLFGNELSWTNASLNTDCNFNCRVQSCWSGCQDLEGSVSMCEDKCTAETVLAPDSCRPGCRAAAEMFLHQIQYLLNHATVETSFDVTQGIQVLWSFDESYTSVLQEISSTNIRWVSQHRSVRADGVSAGWKWVDLPDQSFRESNVKSSVFIPAGDTTEIQIRLAAIWRDHVVVSRAYPQTLSGLALSINPPKLTAKLQLSTNSYVVCWHSERFSTLAATSIRFRLRLMYADGRSISETETAAQCYYFRDLPASPDCCQATIEEVTDETKTDVDGTTTTMMPASESPPTSANQLLVHVELTTVERPKPSDTPHIVFTNGSAVLKFEDLNDYVMLTEPAAIPFSLPEGHTITALTAISATDVLVGLSDGAVYSMKTSVHKAVDGASPDEHPILPTKIREADGTAIIQMSVDHMQGKIYAVREKSGLVRCSLTDCDNSTTLMTNSVSFIHAVAVDSWNGFLYYSTNTGEVFATPLFPLDAPPVFNLGITRRLGGFPPVFTIEVDVEGQRLVALLRNGTLMSMDLVDQSIRDERADVTLNDSYRSVLRSAMLGDRLFWLSASCGDSHPWETCLYSEEFDRDAEKKTAHLNKYLYGGRIQDFTIMRDFLPPAFILPPAKIGLLTSDSEARLTWKPPQSLPYQAPGTQWRALTYECVLTTSDGAMKSVNVTNELSTMFAAKPSRAYTASVRSCSAAVCSAFSNTVNTALPIQMTDASTSTTPAEPTSSTMSSVADGPPKGMQMRRTVVFYGKSGDTYSLLDILGNELPPEEQENYPRQLPVGAVGAAIAYDNSTRSLYSAMPQEVSVFRIFASGIRYRFLDFITVTYMSIMESRALVFVATSYAVHAYHLTSAYSRTIYSCTSASCGEIAGLAADDSSTVYYILRNADGTTQLYSYDLDRNSSVLLATAEGLPTLRQIVVLEDRFAFVTATGHAGTFGRKLESVNINYSTGDVALVLGVTSDATEDHRFRFAKEVSFGVSERNELSWELDPSSEEGSIIYKVELYRGGFGGERTVDITMDSHYTIPQGVLSQWNSRQHFDVQVDAISPWTIVSANRTDITAPAKPPSAPNNLRIFATQQKTVDGTRAVIDFFWDEPREWNGDMLGYVVNCTLDDIVVAGGNISARHSRSFTFTVKSGRVRCIIAARNEQSLVGAFSDPISIDSSEFRPLVRLFAVDSTSQIQAITNWSSVVVPDVPSSSRARRQVSPALRYEAMAFVDGRLYAIRKEPDVSQPFLVQLDVNDVSSVLHKVTMNVDFSEIEAMASDWVADRLLVVANHELLQIPLETLDTLSVVTPKKLFTLSSGAQDAKELVFDPFMNTAYLLSKNGSLFSLDLANGTETNLDLLLNCLKSQTVTSVGAEFTWNRAASPLIYALTWNGILAINPQNWNCTDVNVNWTQFGEKGLKAISSFAVADKMFVFVTSSELLLYDRASSRITSLPITNPPLQQILAVSQSSQPYPERLCFMLPSPSNINFTVKNEGYSGALLEITEPTVPNNCNNISFPPTQYEVHFRKKGSEKLKNVISVTRLIHVENNVLDKETDYEVSVSWFNRYYPSQDSSAPKSLRTGYGFPTAPRDPAGYALTPDTVLLYWKLPETLNAPADEIRYRIIQQSTGHAVPVPIGAKQFVNENFVSDPSDLIGCLENPCRAKIANLRASTEYKFWVKATHVSHLDAQFSHDGEAESPEITARTKDVPGTLRVDNATSESLLLRWSSLQPESAPTTMFVQFKQSGVDASWTDLPNSTFDAMEPTKNLTIDDLRSDTSYDFRFVALYNGTYTYDALERTFDELFYQQQLLQGRTKPGTPGAPLSVKVEKDTDGWVLTWMPPDTDGGAPILSYAVEFRSNLTAEWEIAERGLPADRTRWRIVGKPIDNNDPTVYQFRVRAANSEGFGAYGVTESHVSANAVESESTAHVWLYVLAFFLLTIACVTSAFLLYVRNQKRKMRIRKEKIHKTISLEQLGHIDFPQEPTLIPPEVQNELRNLPKVSHADVEFVKLLGKGSFGDVYMGTVHNIDDEGGKRMSAAIKLLRKGPSQTDRVKFLKEAILMNNFDHPNIVKLLGVSLDSEPHFLVIELMEGGDLHAFLKWSRPEGSTPSHLCLKEMLSMMVDVGRGCAYLEENKHVHRDLAARNCLISSRYSSTRVTKIADFGLARDLYASDYYQVRGEDFLPLRWLAPESVVNGVFSTKSDVWSFGILLWEIMSLGEQPFTGKPNCEVMAAVRNGQHPGQPHECPTEIFAVICQAWEADVQKRPRFADILPQLEVLRGKIEFQSDEPFPSTSYYNDAFDRSLDSSSSINNGSLRAEPRFDKSDNPSAKKHGRPSVLRSLRRVAPSGTINFSDSLSGRSIGGVPTDPYLAGIRPESVLSRETMTTTADYDYEIPRSRTTSDGPTTSSASVAAMPYARHNGSEPSSPLRAGFNNEGFLSDSQEFGYVQQKPTPLRRTRQAPPPPVGELLPRHQSSDSNSWADTPTTPDSPSHLTPARVSRV